MINDQSVRSNHNFDISLTLKAKIKKTLESLFIHLEKSLLDIFT